MTIAEIRDRIEEIRDASDDDEAAHALEDELMKDFILFVSTNPETTQLAVMAAYISEVKDIKFSRWCA